MFKPYGKRENEQLFLEMERRQRKERPDGRLEPPPNADPSLLLRPARIVLDVAQRPLSLG